MLLNLPDELFARLRAYTEEVDWCPLCELHHGPKPTRHRLDCPLKYPPKPVPAAEVMAQLSAVALIGCANDIEAALRLRDIELPEWLDIFQYEGWTDWKAMIPEALVRLWPSFEPHIKVAIYLVAEAAAWRIRGIEAKSEKR